MKMVIQLKLVFKNLKAYHRLIYVRILLLWLFFSAAFFFRFFPWEGYMMHAALTIVFAASFFSLKEKNHQIETLTCSLPVSRNTIVQSRYLTTAVITVSGLLIWFVFSYVAELLYSDPATHFVQIFHFKVVLIILFFVIIHTGIFIPAVFKFNIVGTILLFIIAMIIALVLTLFCFDPFGGSLTTHFVDDGGLLIMSYTILMILFLLISFILSIRLYRRRDL